MGGSTIRALCVRIMENDLFEHGLNHKGSNNNNMHNCRNLNPPKSGNANHSCAIIHRGSGNRC